MVDLFIADKEQPYRCISETKFLQCFDGEKCDGDAAFHVADPRPVCFPIFDMKRPFSSAARCKDGVVVTGKDDFLLGSIFVKYASDDGCVRFTYLNQHGLHTDFIKISFQKRRRSQQMFFFAVTAFQIDQLF